MPVELYAKMENRERLLQSYGHYKGVHPQRLDHFNVFAPDLQGTIDFYAGLGFRLTEYAEEDGDGARITAAWMQRKGNVHDLAFTNGAGPRLHHLAYWVPTALNVIHLCDVMATTGYLDQSRARPRATRHLECVLSVRALPRWPPDRNLHVRLPDHGPRPRTDPLVAARPAPADAVGHAGTEIVVRRGFDLRGYACAGGVVQGECDRRGGLSGHSLTRPGVGRT